MPITTPTGQPYAAYILKLIDLSKVTAGDLLAASSDQVDRIQSRTSRGVDYVGGRFHPYKSDKPYYVSVGSGPNRGRRQSQLAKSTGGRASSKTYGVKYNSYAVYKTATGHPYVDLGGMSGSLLPAIESHAHGVAITHRSGSAGRHIGLDQYPSPGTKFEYGIYTSPADKIALGHNEGVSGKLPKRRFLDSSQVDIGSMEDLIERRIEARTAKITG